MSFSKNKICSECGTSDTPQFRVFETKVLCNACGVKKKRDAQKNAVCCSHCGTSRVSPSHNDNASVVCRYCAAKVKKFGPEFKVNPLKGVDVRVAIGDRGFVLRNFSNHKEAMIAHNAFLILR